MKIKWLRWVFSVLLTAVLVSDHVVSAKATAGQFPEEAVGKEDPFEVVIPIAEAKKTIIQKLTGSAARTDISPAPALGVQAVMLKFLKAANIKPAIDGLLSEYGVSSIDAETNTIIVCDAVDNLEKIVSEIRKADQTPKQIMVEVVIVDVQLKDDTEIGVDWNHFAYTKNYTQTLIPTSITTGATFNLIRDDVGMTISALQKIRNVKILASPRVLVVSGAEAFIETTEEIPYVELTQSTGGVGASDSITSTEFKEAGITLKVKAVITDEQKILMTLEPSQKVNTGVAGVGDSDVPIVNKRSVKTTVLMDEDQVLVMGGLRRKDVRVTVDKVPLLGDLPFIGFLFSNDKKVIENSELLVFISPHIQRDRVLSESEQERLDEVRNLPSVQMPGLDRLEFRMIRDWLNTPAAE